MTDDAPANESPKPGCFSNALIVGGLALVGGTYLLQKWNTLQGAGKAGAIVLVVLGTLMVLPFILLLAFKLFVRRLLGKAAADLGVAASELSKAGADIVANNKRLFQSQHEYRDAVESDFQSLDRDRYEKTTQELLDRGYRLIGDRVNVTVEKQGVVTVIRALASPDGTTLAGIFHFPRASKARGLEGKTLFTIDLETEFSDGTFLVTSNTLETDLLTPPPAIKRQRLTLETPLAEMIEAHESYKQQALAAQPGLTCTVVDTMEDVSEFQHRQHAAKVAFRSKIGHVDPEEVHRIAKSRGVDDHIADAIANAADEAAKKEGA